MLKIRLQRVGRKNDPSFRIVVIDSRRGPQSGNFIKVLGSYNARRDALQIKADAVKHWLGQGAKTSGSLHNLLLKQKIIAGKKINVYYRRRQQKKVDAPPA